MSCDMDDWHLLNEYATQGSEDAFRELVDRYAGMVYHAALRQVRNPEAAQDVTQMVFVALAQKAHRIPRQSLLYGWLFRATRYAVMHMVRKDTRRRRYEKEATNMEPNVEPNEAETVWDEISPYLNDALDRLSELDREVVMIRFFGKKSHKEVGLALGLSEDRAKKRLSRALERLRVTFARRGVVVPSLVLAAAFSTCGAQAAPAGLSATISAAALAKGAGATPVLALGKVVLKWMAWAKANTAAVGAGVLLAAAGTATVAVTGSNSPSGDIITQLEHRSGKRIAWDKHIELSAGLDLKRLPLERALDDVSIHSGAYWTVDYAVYSSDPALRQLLDALHEGAALETAGWTNLSSRPFQANILILPPRNLGGVGGGTGGGGAGAKPRGVKDGMVSMMAALDANAFAKWNQNVQRNFKRREQGDPNVKVLDTEESATLQQAMNEGVVDGVLAPERLLAEARLVSRIGQTTPVPPTAEAADQIAKATRAHWVTIYTLRKSPLDGAGIKLVHTGMESMYWPTQTNGSFAEFVQGSLTNRFNLGPEDRAAHARAVQAFKNGK
jgi:RNA polymerase sigma factor (sigma-70 family)